MQWTAEASQKFTCPTFSAVAPACTVAVSVIAVPDLTVVTALRPEVAVSVVVVTVPVAAAGKPDKSKTQSNPEKRDLYWYRLSKNLEILGVQDILALPR